MPCRPVALNTFFWYFSRNCFFPLFEILKLSLLKLSVQPRLVSNLHCLPSAPSVQGFIKHGPAHLAPATVPSWLLSSGFPAVDFSPQPRDETTLSTSWGGVILPVTDSFSVWFAETCLHLILCFKGYVVSLYNTGGLFVVPTPGLPRMISSVWTGS